MPGVSETTQPNINSNGIVASSVDALSAEVSTDRLDPTSHQLDHKAKINTPETKLEERKVTPTPTPATSKLRQLVNGAASTSWWLIGATAQKSAEWLLPKAAPYILKALPLLGIKADNFTAEDKNVLSGAVSSLLSKQYGNNFQLSGSFSTTIFEKTENGNPAGKIDISLSNIRVQNINSDRSTADISFELQINANGQEKNIKVELKDTHLNKDHSLAEIIYKGLSPFTPSSTDIAKKAAAPGLSLLLYALSGQKEYQPDKTPAIDPDQVKQAIGLLNPEGPISLTVTGLDIGSSLQKITGLEGEAAAPVKFNKVEVNLGKNINLKEQFSYTTEVQGYKATIDNLSITGLSPVRLTTLDEKTNLLGFSAGEVSFNITVPGKTAASKPSVINITLQDIAIAGETDLVSLVSSMTQQVASSYINSLIQGGDKGVKEILGKQNSDIQVSIGNIQQKTLEAGEVLTELDIPSNLTLSGNNIVIRQAINSPANLKSRTIAPEISFGDVNIGEINQVKIPDQSLEPITSVTPLSIATHSTPNQLTEYNLTGYNLEIKDIKIDGVHPASVTQHQNGSYNLQAEVDKIEFDLEIDTTSKTILDQPIPDSINRDPEAKKRFLATVAESNKKAVGPIRAKLQDELKKAESEIELLQMHLKQVKSYIKKHPFSSSSKETKKQITESLSLQQQRVNELTRQLKTTKIHIQLNNVKVDGDSNVNDLIMANIKGLVTDQLNSLLALSNRPSTPIKYEINNNVRAAIATTDIKINEGGALLESNGSSITLTGIKLNRSQDITNKTIDEADGSEQVSQIKVHDMMVRDIKVPGVNFKYIDIELNDKNTGMIMLSFGLESPKNTSIKLNILVKDGKIPLNALIRDLQLAKIEGNTKALAGIFGILPKLLPKLLANPRLKEKNDTPHIKGYVVLLYC